MLDIHGRDAGWSGPGLNRRDFLRVGALSAAGLTLADWLKAEGPRPGPRGQGQIGHPVLHAGRPDASGHLRSQARGRQRLLRPAEEPDRRPTCRASASARLLPLTAKQADKFSIIRSYTHQDFGHETAAYTVATGALPAGEMVYPSMGAVTSLKKGYDAGYQGGLPPYITLTTPLPWFSDTGFLGTKYQTFATLRRSERQELPRPGPGDGRRAERPSGWKTAARCCNRSTRWPGRWTRSRPSRKSTASTRRPTAWSWATPRRRSTCRRKRTRCATSTGATSSGSRACWPAGWWNRACRSSRSTGAGGTRTPTISGP